MDKQTYTQWVDAIVERMAKTMYTGKRLVAERYSPVILCCAQQAVAEIAEAIRHYDNTLLDSDAAYVERYLKEQGLIPDNETDILPMQPGEPGYGGYNPDNPEPDNVKQLLIRLLYNVQDALDEYAYARNNPDIPGNGKTKLLAEVERRLNKCRKIVENNLNAKEGAQNAKEVS